MENKYIQQLREITVEFFKDENVKIILFGSRARNDNYISSDVDIGIIPYGKFDEKKITLLRDKIDNLNIPYKVEIVNFREVSPEFKEEALRKAAVWKD